MSVAHTWDRLGDPLEGIDTPVLLIDAAACERNLARMTDFARRESVAIRPHAKAHKSGILAQRQIAHGAIGVCCQKVGEAEAMAAAGVRDILVSNEVVGRAKWERLAALARIATLTVAVDSREAAEGLASAAQRAGVTLGVVVDVDLGQGRCGVRPGPEAVALGTQVDRLPGLVLRGLQGYQGKLQHLEGYEVRRQAALAAQALLMDVRIAFERAGLPLDIVSGGGTGTYDTVGAMPGMTEIQPGSYLFMDRHYRSIGGRAGGPFDDFECALTVLATVISAPTAERRVVDAGLKAVTNDSGPAGLVDVPGWEYVVAGDEHGVLVRRGEGPRLEIGDQVRILPSHCDTTVNLYDVYHVVRDGHLEAVWSIDARGKLR